MPFIIRRLLGVSRTRIELRIRQRGTLPLRAHVTMMVVMLSCGAFLFAQNPTGRISGLVLDKASAAVPAASVRLTRIETNVVTAATTNDAGVYEVQDLVAGTYQLQVEKSGFKLYTQGPIQVRVGDVLRVDVRLELGAVTQTVTVRAAAPMLELSTASNSMTLDNQRVTSLPITGSDVNFLVLLSPEIMLTNTPMGQWIPSSETAGFAADGTRTNQNEFALDGIPNNQTTIALFEMPPETVQEVQVLTNSFDAAYGHQLGIHINTVLKSGTNQLHGMLNFTYLPSNLSSLAFFADATYRADLAAYPNLSPEQVRKLVYPPSHLTRFRPSISGPVYIPKLYDGRNRTFFMFGDDLYKDIFCGVGTTTVPTAAERQGDFSALLALGSNYQIYDPATITPTTGGLTSRQPFTGNIIPTARLDPIALKLEQYWPVPNQAALANGENNYHEAYTQEIPWHSNLVRVDHNLSERQRLFAHFTEFGLPPAFQSQILGTSNIAGGYYALAGFRGAALGYNISLGPATVLDLHYGGTFEHGASGPDSQGFNLPSLGLPSSLVSQISPKLYQLPIVNTDVFAALTTYSASIYSRNDQYLSAGLTKMRGSHALRMGVEWRDELNNNTTYGNVVPNYTFGSTWTVGPLSTSAAAPVGDGFASFLLGLPTAGDIDRNASMAERTKYWAGYFQDDWKVRHNLTVNLGLRYEVESPTTERYNRENRGFNVAATSPVAAAAQAQYALNPIPQVPVSQFQVLGGLLFAGVNGEPRGMWNTDGRNFGPRVGLAWRFRPNTVVRAGWGVFYDSLGVNYNTVLQQGFSQSTALVPSTNNGVTFTGTLDNPYPNGVLTPPGSSLGLATLLGGAPTFFDPNARTPINNRWSLTVQREFPGRVMIELGYVGNRGTHLQETPALDAVPNSYLSTLPTRDQTTINTLSAQVANPFYGLPQFAGTALATTTVATTQLLLPHPEFTGITPTAYNGLAWYNAGHARAEKRVSHGWSVEGSVTWSKFMQATEFLHSADVQATHVISDLDRPWVISGSSVYELPFGRGRRFLSNGPSFVNEVVGGWHFNTLYMWQSGAPVSFGDVAYSGSLSDIALSRSQRKLTEWFNTSGFVTASSQQLADNYRTFPLRLTSVRQDDWNYWNMSLAKKFRLHEGVDFVLRVDSVNALNHPMFSAPNATPTSTAFGTVTGTISSTQREFWFIGELEW